MPEVDIDQIMQKIREEVQRRKQEAPSPGLSRSFPSSGSLPAGAGPGLLRPQRTPSFEYKSDYHVRDFLPYHDGDFVRNAYRGLLKREPDPNGYEQYLGRLRSGERSKIEILGRIRYSAEGRAKNVRIRGLLVPLGFNLAYRVPVAGYILRLATAIAKLPIFLRNLREFEAFTHARLAESRSDQGATFSKVNGRIEEINARVAQLADSSWVNALRREMSALASSKADVQVTQTLREQIVALELSKAESQRLETLRQSLDDAFGDIKKELWDLKRNTLDQQRRLTLLLDEARKRFPQPLDESQAAVLAKECDHVLDAMYVSFEDQFRGTREDIKERQRVYLAYLDPAVGKARQLPIIDVGCGRGEWLELLRENGWKATGVDLNRIMIDECRDRGLEATEADGVEFLRTWPGGSVEAVTAFHVVEHLSLQGLVSLLDEAFRVLRPGGALILETPNPGNLLVSSYYFHLDPTHRKPLPSETLKFLAEARGFSNTKILYLHPGPEDPTLEDGEIMKRLGPRFFGPQDLGLVGWKAPLQPSQ